MACTYYSLDEVTLCRNSSECLKTTEGPFRETNLEYFCLLDAPLYVLVDVCGRYKVFTVLHY